MSIDPVTLAVVRGSLEQIADEMDLHLIHAAISPIISETNDCAHGIFDPISGETIAQGRYGLPVFLANMQFTTQNVVKLANAQGGFKPGDVHGNDGEDNGPDSQAHSQVGDPEYRQCQAFENDPEGCEGKNPSPYRAPIGAMTGPPLPDNRLHV